MWVKNWHVGGSGTLLMALHQNAAIICHCSSSSDGNKKTVV